MNLLLWGITLGTVGKLILGMAVLRVHAYILREHKIDDVVLSALRHERYVTLIGILLIIIGYIFEIYFYGNTTNLLDCTGEACASAISAAFAK